MQCRFCHIHWSKANKFLPGTMFNFSMKTYTTYTIVSRARIFWSRCILVLKQYIQPFPAKPDTICANCNCVHFCWIIQICLTTFLVLFSCNKNVSLFRSYVWGITIQNRFLFNNLTLDTNSALSPWPWSWLKREFNFFMPGHFLHFCIVSFLDNIPLILIEKVAVVPIHVPDPGEQ